MKLWIDEVRPAPEGYVWCRSVNETREVILSCESDVEYHWKHYGYISTRMVVELIDIDHNAGEYAPYGGDYIRLLDWLEETGRNYPIHIHSQNVVGRINMEAICRRNGWTIVP